MTTDPTPLYLGPRPLHMKFNSNIDLDGAACRPWTGTHDSRRRGESDQQFQARLSIAKAICASCPVAVDCLAHTQHYRDHHVPLDGIFAGQHLRYGGDAA